MRVSAFHRSAPVFFLLVCLLVPGCRPRQTWHASTLLFFDTVCELKISASGPLLSSAQKDVSDAFSEIETLFSPGSSLSAPLVDQLFRQSYEVYRHSGGSFDISIAPLSRLWGFRSRDYRVPGEEDIRQTLNRVGLDRIDIARDHLVIPEGMELDWGGIAKGFGIDRAVSRLNERHVSHGFINAGGDLFCWGKNPEGKDWRIGIQHPRHGGFLGVLTISGLGAATTGDYQRFFIEDGKRYHHVFNPKTGYPAEGKQSVTVVGPKTMICDALSTALFVSSNPEKILANYPEYGAVIVNDKGSITTLGKTPPLFLEP